MMRSGIVLLSLAQLCTRAVCAQQAAIADGREVVDTAPAPSAKFPAKWYAHPIDTPDTIDGPIRELPYVGIVGSVTPTLENGAEQTSTTESQARDRQGRTRTQSTTGMMAIHGISFSTDSVVVSDPVSHCDFYWTQPTSGGPMPPAMRVAYVSCRRQTLTYRESRDLYGEAFDHFEETLAAHGDPLTGVERPPPVQLGDFTVARIRVTNTSAEVGKPASSTTSEIWYSKELRQIVRFTLPEGGYAGFLELHHVDPEPSLFYPPADYQIELVPPKSAN